MNAESNSVGRYERFTNICNTVYQIDGNYALMKGNRFCGYPFLGIWKTKDDLMVFGTAYVIYTQMDNQLMTWKEYKLTTGKTVMLPIYDNQELIWVSGTY